MGASNASEAPVACSRATMAPSGQRNAARARSMLPRQRRSASASNAIPGATSSAAPGPSKYGLAPVSRRESSNGSLTSASPATACSVAFLALEAQAALVAHHAFHRRDQPFVERGVERGHFGARRRLGHVAVGLEADDLLPGARQGVG